MPSSTPELLPAALAEHSVESLLSLHGASRPWIYWISLLAVILAMGALPFVRVDLTVRASGVIRPRHERAELKATIGGRVARVWARDNDRVVAGQPLVELVSGDVREQLARNAALQRERTRDASDVRELAEKVADKLRGGEAPELRPDIVKLETAFWSQGFAQFLAQYDSSRLALAKAHTNDERTAALAERGIVTRLAADDTRYAADRAAWDLQLIVRQALASWQTQLRDDQVALDQLVSDEKRLTEELSLAIVRAPATGTVQGLTGLRAGINVSAGQSFGYVSPEDELVVEALVSPRDVGQLRVGQPARLQIDTYPYTQWGLVEGTVESVAADAAIYGQQACFRVLVRPAVLTLRLGNGVKGTLRKGMTLTARFVVAQRSLLQVLHEDAARWLDPQGPPAPSRPEYFPGNSAGDIERKT